MSKNISTPLVAAAETLEQELARFDETLESLKRLSLRSKKNLDRAAGMLNELGDIEGKIGVHIQALIKAIGATGETQLARVNEVKVCAGQVQERALAFKALIAQFEELGTGASSLKDKMQGPSPTVVDVVQELGVLAVRAEALQAEAKTEGFDDVVHLADGLKNQLHSLQDKLGSVG